MLHSLVPLQWYQAQHILVVHGAREGYYAPTLPPRPTLTGTKMCHRVSSFIHVMLTRNKSEQNLGFKAFYMTG